MALTEQISQREQAYQRLRRLLVLQQIPEGRRLRETVWSTKLKVNRAALREAFARLEAEGFVERGPKTGYFVPEIASEDLTEVVEVRVMLEGGAIERIIQKGLNTRGQLQLTIEACDQLERLMNEDYLLGVAEADRRFHEALIDAARNRRLAILYQRAPLPIIHPVLISGSQWTARVEQTLKEHRAIIDAVLEGDTAKALKVLREHLNERAFIPLYAG
ncbi:MAG TPA: GntR family transcriptional regulator [Phycisphaerae bacterium]|nr:GntR family transcriptional regulator [Phycisphaerae bacterium]